MKYGNLVIEESEYNFIKELLTKVGSKDAVHEACYARLRKEMVTAIIKKSEDMPEDVIRINSKIDVETPFGLIKDYQLVLPKDGNPQAKKLSILTPMGSALIGYASGDELMWNFPKGEEKIAIKKVAQQHS